jgi:hypothetical protein
VVLIPKFFRSLPLLLIGFLSSVLAVSAQSAFVDTTATPDATIASPALLAAAELPSAIVPNLPIDSTYPQYARPTQEQKLRYYASDAIGPEAFAGASFSGAIDQKLNLPGAWKQGMAAYRRRLISNLGIRAINATAQYSLSEAFREDTAYYRCTCSGLLPRFAHAAMSTVTARRGSDGHTAFSFALTMSPFIGPTIASNTWLPVQNGPALSFQMGERNLLGRLGQNEAREFLYGSPHTLLGHLQRGFFKKFSSR